MDIIVVLVLAVHLLAANVASAGPLVCGWFEHKEGRGDQLAGGAGRYLMFASLVGLIAASLLGLLLGFLVWDNTFRGVIARFPSKVFFGVWELVFSLVLIALHWFWWKKAPNCGWAARGTRIFIGILASTNLLYHFPFLFAVMVKAVAGGVPGEGEIDAAAFRVLITDGEVLSKVVHVWLASFAVTGVTLLGFALRQLRSGDNGEDFARVARWGGYMALVPTLLQVPVGIWIVTQLPSQAAHELMGESMIATALLLLSVGLAFPLMHYLAAVAMRDATRSSVIRSMALMTTIVVLMTGVLHTTNSVEQMAPPSSVEPDNKNDSLELES